MPKGRRGLEDGCYAKPEITPKTIQKRRSDKKESKGPSE